MLELTVLPSVNATLNAVAGACLVCGFVAIRRGAVTIHKRFMLGAVTGSVLFLASYLTYHFNVPVTRFQGEGAARVVYFAILLSHTVLAAAVVPLALITLYRALRGDFVRHPRIARWTLPIWLYVSVTGVIVYLMLYHLYPAPGA